MSFGRRYSEVGKMGNLILNDFVLGSVIDQVALEEVPACYESGISVQVLLYS
jgi:hypothetical protein